MPWAPFGIHVEEALSNGRVSHCKAHLCCTFTSRLDQRRLSLRLGLVFQFSKCLFPIWLKFLVLLRAASCLVFKMVIPKMLHFIRRFLNMIKIPQFLLAPSHFHSLSLVLEEPTSFICFQKEFCRLRAFSRSTYKVMLDWKIKRLIASCEEIVTSANTHSLSSQDSGHGLSDRSSFW